MGCRQKRYFKTSGRLILFTLLLPAISFSSEPERFLGARASGLGNSTIALIDPWSILNNQAGLGWQRSPWAGIYHENQYLLKELSLSSLVGCVPVKPGTFGIGLTHFGFSQFNQSRFSLSYGMMLSKGISAGVGINYQTIHLTRGYGSTECITAEGGIIYQPLNSFAIGAHVFNPTQSSLGSSQKLPTSFGIGVAYRPVDNVLIAIQGDDNTQSSPVFRTGIEYAPVTNFSFRIGMLSNPISLSFGLGWKVKAICIDLAFSYHEVLGYTPYISLSYSFKSKSRIQDKPEQ